MKECNKCKKNIPNDSEFCPYCGGVQKKNNQRIIFVVSLIGFIIILFCVIIGFTNTNKRERANNDTNYFTNTYNSIENMDNVEDKMFSCYVGNINSSQKVNKLISREDIEKFSKTLDYNTKEKLFVKEILYENVSDEYPNQYEIYVSNEISEWVIFNDNTNNYTEVLIATSYTDNTLKNKKDSIYYVYSPKEGSELNVCNAIIRENYYNSKDGKLNSPRFENMRGEEEIFEMIRSVFDSTYEIESNTNLKIFHYTK